MPFIPHTKDETEAMLSVIGARKIDDLFDEIPSRLRLKNNPDDLGLSELEISQLMTELANQDGTPTCFAGAGAYDHHIPAAVWEIATRGEFYSAYTPYQAEASQGTLQLLYEFQSMMAHLMDMDVSNTSLYDGASGLAEAILMAVRANRKSKSKKILMPKTTHPSYRQVAHNIVKNQNIELVEVDFDLTTGTLPSTALEPFDTDDFAAMVISFPNYFGQLEDIDALTDWASERGILVIAQVNPMAVSWLKPPGQWGKNGADIVCGEGQPLGIPLSSGGPYFGFLCCQAKLVRQMPGRIIGQTEDLDGKVGYSLTLQAREQHIRRSKATSNICTNQGLMVTAATIYMSLMGEKGLRHTAIKSHENTQKLVKKLTEIQGVKVVFSGTKFHEVVLKIPTNVKEVIRALSVNNIVGGVSLTDDYPELGEALLVCATEKRTDKEMTHFFESLQRIIQRRNPVKCTIAPKNW